MHLVFLIDGEVRQTGYLESIPKGVQYWNVTAAEKEWMEANRDKRDAWVWAADRPADGVR